MKSVVTWFRSMHQCVIAFQEQHSIKYFKEILLSGFFLLLVASGVILHRLYVNAREQRAFIALTEVIESYTRAVYQAREIDKIKDFEKFKSVWQDADILSEELYRDHINSYLAPFFLVIHSDIIVQRDGNVDQAIEVLDRALVDLPKKSAIGSLYRLKRIKMGFDSSDASIQQQSLKDLQILVQDKTSLVYQEALYTLASFYIAQQEIEKARECLVVLSSQEDAAALIPSIWVNLAKERLGQVPVTKAA